MLQVEIRQLSSHTKIAAFFMGGSQFFMINECITFAKDHGTEGNFQQFIDMMADLKFIAVEKFIPGKSYLDQMHTEKAKNIK